MSHDGFGVGGRLVSEAGDARQRSVERVQGAIQFPRCGADPFRQLCHVFPYVEGMGRGGGWRGIRCPGPLQIGRIRPRTRWPPDRGGHRAAGLQSLAHFGEQSRAAGFLAARSATKLVRSRSHWTVENWFSAAPRSEWIRPAAIRWFGQGTAPTMKHL